MTMRMKLVCSNYYSECEKNPMFNLVGDRWIGKQVVFLKVNYDFLVVFRLRLLTKAAIVWSALFLSSGLTTGFRSDKSIVDFLWYFFFLKGLSKFMFFSIGYSPIIGHIRVCIWIWNKECISWCTPLIIWQIHVNITQLLSRIEERMRNFSKQIYITNKPTKIVVKPKFGSPYSVTVE